MVKTEVVAILMIIAFCCAIPSASFMCDRSFEGTVCTEASVDVRQLFSDPWELNGNEEMRNLTVEIRNNATYNMNNVTFFDIFPKNVACIAKSLQRHNWIQRPSATWQGNRLGDYRYSLEVFLGNLNASSSKIINLTVSYDKSDLVDFDENVIAISAEPEKGLELEEANPKEANPKEANPKEANPEEANPEETNLTPEELELLSTGPRITAISQFNKPTNSSVSYIILVKNSGDVAVDPVILEVTLPERSDISTTSREPTKRNDSIIFWTIGKLAPSDAWDLELLLVPNRDFSDIKDEADQKRELQKMELKVFGLFDSKSVSFSGQSSPSAEWEDSGY